MAGSERQAATRTGPDLTLDDLDLVYDVPEGEGEIAEAPDTLAETLYRVIERASDAT